MPQISPTLPRSFSATLSGSFDTVQFAHLASQTPITEVSVVGVTDVSIETDVDLPSPALRLHEEGQHCAVSLNDRLDVLAQNLHQFGHFLPQRAFVNAGAFAIGYHNAAIDDNGLNAASAFREYDLASNAVKRNERRIGEIDNGQVGGHPWQ